MLLIKCLFLNIAVLDIFKEYSRYYTTIAYKEFSKYYIDWILNYKHEELFGFITLFYIYDYINA